MSLYPRVLPGILLAPLLACGPSEMEPDCSQYKIPLSPPPATSRHLACGRRGP
jgi:hypothetical protein